MTFRRVIPAKDGQKIDMLKIDSNGDLALKATDQPVVVNREMAAEIINALAEAFDFPVHASAGVTDILPWGGFAERLRRLGSGRRGDTIHVL